MGFERALVLDLLTQAEADVAAVDSALTRLGAGTYGRCVACGLPIGDERLVAHPTAVHCVGCAQARAAATSSRVRATLKSGVPGSRRRPAESGPAS